MTMTMSSCGEVICLNFDKLFASDFSAHNFVIYKDYMSCAVLRLSLASVHHILSLLYSQSFHSTKRFSRSPAVQFSVSLTRTKLSYHRHSYPIKIFLYNSTITIMISMFLFSSFH